jgi:2-oxo-4-hydroxy-4-carboxy-5-ureidoimidazoline decarboxylase
MTLHDLNTMDQRKLRELLLQCCGSTGWAKMMLTHFPAEDLVDLEESAEEVWFECSEDDWREAFSKHPQIGDVETLRKKFEGSTEATEQSGINSASTQTLEALAEGNKAYEEKFGFTFIVCATGKSAEEMLGNLQSRLRNPPAEEIKIAADEQSKITKLRLEKLLED